MKDTFAKGITWDLSDLYPSADSLKIEEDLKLAESKALQFKASYKPLFEGIIKNGIPTESARAFPLKPLLEDYKKIAILMTKPAVFAHLSFAAKTNDTQTGAFLQRIQTRLTEIQSHLLFFEVFWNKLEASVIEKLIRESGIKEEIHFLEKLRVYAPHTLSEGEENIMAIKANTSGRAFSRLFDEVVNNIPFYIEVEGKKIRKNKSEVLSLLHSQNRDERKKSSESLAEGLNSHSHLLTYIFNMILADHRSNLKIRDHTHPMDPMNLSNEIDLESVMNLIQSVKKAYPMAARFYHLKRRLLGFDKLYDYDRYAPIDLDETRVDFKECKEIVLSGYYDFSEEAGKIVELFFTKRWIDAEIRDGKHGGGFCAQTTPDLHPYILVNYTGSMRDVMTVAHELGHGLHQYLAAKRVGILESDAPLTMAETASVFGEMLIFEKILKDQKDPKKRLALICGKIDDHFATVFRQIAMTNFELMSHTEGLEKGELSNEKFNDFWISANGELYGDSVELSDNYQHGWKYIPHFIHSPFYCYAYAFAQLFVLVLYQKYKEDKGSFIPKYLEMLSLGGSKKPEELAAIVGLNIRDSKFWQSGINLLDNFVKQAEELAH